MQKAYISALYELMQKDARVCSLLSDSGTEYDEMMAREFSNQCFNFGIAEQNKVAAASGMAALGKIPFVYTTGAFLAYRSYEFIRDDICFQRRNVKIVGMGSSTAWNTLGASHHTTEDISALRALPNLVLLSPASPIEARKCVLAAYEIEGPVYIRTGMSGEEEIFADDYDFKIGGAVVMRDGSDAALFSTGSLTSEVLKAVALLDKEGVSVKLIHLPTIKPIDEETIFSVASKIKKLFSVEEHSIQGGLGGAVAEVVAQSGTSAILERIGLNDRFACGYGTQSEVRKMNGLDSDGIYKQIIGKLTKK